jgi:hypothetical protein
MSKITAEEVNEHEITYGDTGKICCTCRFYEFFAYRFHDSHGECHRHAPSPHTLMIDPGDSVFKMRTVEGADNSMPEALSIWPSVRGNSWCGEWQRYDDSPEGEAE